MHLDRLRSFVAFAELLNFTRAAERLNISQPALHVQINKLAESLGVPLYVRDGRALRLTEEGRETEAFARRILDEVDAFEEGMGGGAGAVVPRLCAGRDLQLYLLDQPVRSWLRGGGRVRLSTGNAAEAVDALRTRQAHLGVAAVSSRPEGLGGVLLRRVEQVAILQDADPLSVRASLRLLELSRRRLILPPPARPHSRAVLEALETSGMRARIRLEAGGWELMMHYASLGMGTAVVDDYCRPPAGTRAVPIPELPDLSCFLLFRDDGRLPAEARRLAEHLCSGFGAEAPRW